METTKQNPQQDPLPSDTGTTTSPEPERICGYRVHPAANLLPDPTPEEFERMVADIREHGIIKPVILFDPEDPDANGAYADGGDTDPMILDGRSRARVWERLGREVYDLPTRDLVEVSPQHCSDPIGFVLSMNATRRHLTPAQIAAVWIQGNALKIEVQRAEAAEREKAGKAPSRTGAVGSGGTVAAQVSKTTGVGTRTVEKVLAVQKVAPEKMKDIIERTTTPNKVLALVAPKRDPFCVHANPRANCSECCNHGKAKHTCISCNGKGNTLPAVSSKPTKLPKPGEPCPHGKMERTCLPCAIAASKQPAAPPAKPKTKTQIKRDEIEARKVQKQIDFITSELRPDIYLHDYPSFVNRDIDGTVKEMVERLHEWIQEFPAVPSAVVVAVAKRYADELAFQTEVYRGFLAAIEKVEAA